jgi:HAD superfamily hydrolase (TIGR01450 family)
LKTKLEATEDYYAEMNKIYNTLRNNNNQSNSLEDIDLKISTIKGKKNEIYSQNPNLFTAEVDIDNYEDLYNAEILFNDKLALISQKKAFILDKDGTITIGKTPIDGAFEFLSELEKKNKQWLVGSNNSSKTSEIHADGLKSVFQKLNNIIVISSLDVAVNYFKNQGVKRLFWLGNKQVSQELSRYFIADDEDPECLLLTYDDEINYEKLKKLIKLIRRGVPYYATHIDIVCPTEYGDIPDIGSFIELIYESTKARPIKSFGKPSKYYLNYILNFLNVDPSEAVLIGDRLYTDIMTCENEDVLSILVLSGETTRSMYEESEVRANIVIPSLRNLLDYI